jgi:hypothetical protein
MICCLRCNSSQGNELLQLTPHWSIPSLNNCGIWLPTPTCWCVFIWLCQCHLDLEGDKRPSSSYLGHFSSSKSFDHITKDASVFHLKSGGNRRLSCFSPSTPSKHTSHHHDRSIASCRFLTHKYGQPSTCSQLWTWEIFTTILSQLYVLSLLLFLKKYSFIHFINLQYIS